MKLKSINGLISSKLTIINPPDCLRKDLINSLTFRNPAYDSVVKYSAYAPTWRTPKTLCFVEEEDNGSITFPRGIIPRKDLSPKSLALFRRIEWAECRVSNPVTFPLALTIPNAEQDILLSNFDRHINNDSAPFGNFLYVSPTGTGKTLTMLGMSSRVGEKTLILCGTDLIKRTWYADITKGFGIHKRDIGIIQASKWQIGEHVTLAMIPTLGRRRSRWEELFDEFGCLIVDESDTVSGPTLFQIVQACRAKYIFGATATDRQKSSSSFYTRLCFGAVKARILPSVEDTATSMALRAVRQIPTAFTYDTGDEVLSWADLTEAMSVDEDRNQQIVAEVVKDWKAGRTILVTTKRLGHAQLLSDMLKMRGVIGVNLLTGETNTHDFYSEKLHQGIMRRTMRCTIATVAAIKRGASINTLDTLHLTMPLANQDDLEQLIGRIRRRADLKSACELVYYVDISDRYLFGLFKRIGVPVFRKLKVPNFVNAFYA